MKRSSSLTSLLVCVAMLAPLASGAASQRRTRAALRKARATRPESRTEVRKVQTPSAVDNPEYALWSGGTNLRGANVWLKVRDARRDTEVPQGASYLYPTYELEDFQKLRAWGANYVSFSCPGVYRVKAPHGFDELAMNELKFLIGLARAAGLYVTVGFRTGPLCEESRFKTSDTSRMWGRRARAAREKWGEMWGKAASELKDLPNVVGYELMIEPDAPRPDDWNRLAADIVRKIREGDGVTPVIIGGAADEGDGSSADALKNVGVFDDPFVVYTVHQYRPNAFTQQEKFKDKFEPLLSYDCPPGETPLDPKAAREIIGYDGCEEVSCREAMRAAYADIDSWREGRRMQTGTLPSVAVTETGVVRWAPGADESLRAQFEELDARGFNHALWRWGPKRCTGDDEFDIRHGHEFKLHLIDEGATNRLWSVVTVEWAKNKTFAPPRTER